MEAAPKKSPETGWRHYLVVLQDPDLARLDRLDRSERYRALALATEKAQSDLNTLLVSHGLGREAIIGPANGLGVLTATATDRAIETIRQSSTVSRILEIGDEIPIDLTDAG